MGTFHSSFDVDAPVEVAYGHWTRFGEFAGDSEIREQEQDRLIAWRSRSGKGNSGRVRFEPLGPQRTRVEVELECEKADDMDEVIAEFKRSMRENAEAGGEVRGAQVFDTPAGQQLATPTMETPGPTGHPPARR